MGIAGLKCLHPLSLKFHVGFDDNWTFDEYRKEHYLYVPCGHCIACKMAKSREWSLRLKMESMDYPREEIVFTTLTYDEDHVPKIDSVLTLCSEDLKNFMKRLRRRINYRIRYFACGEYG